MWANPAMAAICLIGRSVVASSERAQSICSRRISLWMVRPVTALNFVSERGSRDADGRHHVGDADRPATVLVDEGHRGGHVGIGDRQDVGRAAGDHFLGRNERQHLLGLLARHQPIQQRRRLIAQVARAVFDAAQRRVGQLANHFVVVDAQHGDVLGHAQADRPAGFQDVAGPGVVRGHQPDRLFQRFEPHGQLVLDVDPFPHRRLAAGVDDARQPCSLAYS